MKRLQLPRKCWIASALAGLFFLSYTQAFSTSEPKLMSKSEKLGLGLSDTPRGMTQKMLPPVNVRIQRVGSFEAGKNITYRAHISSDFSSPELRYHWELPEGLILAKGSDKGSLFDVKAFESYLVEISARSDTAENQQIHLYVTNMDPSNSSTASAQYNTVDQEEIDIAVKELHEKTKQASNKEALR